MPLTPTIKADPTGMPPVEIVTNIIDSYHREALWKQWGREDWAKEEQAHRERAMQELINRGFTTLVPQIKELDERQKLHREAIGEGLAPAESPARRRGVRNS